MTSQKLANDTPIRRSARNRRPVVNVFDSSGGDDDESDFEYVPAARRLPAKKRTQRNHFVSGNQQSAVRGIATQTSPGLLRQQEKEERRRNFF